MSIDIKPCPFCGGAPALVYHGFAEQYMRHNTYYWALETNILETAAEIMEYAKYNVEVVSRDSRNVNCCAGGGTPWWTVTCSKSVGYMTSHGVDGCPFQIDMNPNLCFRTPEEAIKLWNVRMERLMGGDQE